MPLDQTHTGFPDALKRLVRLREHAEQSVGPLRSLLCQCILPHQAESSVAEGSARRREAKTSGAMATEVLEAGISS